MSVLFLAALLLQAGSASIQGVVVRGMETPEYPLETARVELTGGSQGALVTRTNSSGEFSFSNLPPGNYGLSVKKDGYVRQEYGPLGQDGKGATLTVGAGTRVEGIVFRLKPAVTLSGRVRNEYGVPIANILIQALRRGYDVRGNRIVTVFSNALTDDRGEYRLYWLDPATYYVNASYLPILPTPVNANEDASREAYAPTYYPGATDPTHARAIEATTEREISGIDFKLDRSQTVTVRGTTYSVVKRGPVAALVSLASPPESGSSSRYTVESDEKGAFEMKGIVSGTYILSAKTVSGDGQIGLSAITVRDRDYSTADIMVGPGVTLNVMFFTEAGATVDLRSTTVTLLPVEWPVPAPQPATLQPNGSFIFTQVQPGNYVIRVTGLPDGSYVKAARYADRDSLEDFAQIRYDTAGPLNILLGLDGGLITGAAVNEMGQAFLNATVVLVPDKMRRHRQDQYSVTRTGQNGMFSLRGIPPGEYKLFAWESVDESAYMNPEFISAFEDGGLPLQIGPATTLSTQVRVIPRQ
jgi:hypothetical protein